MANNPSKLKAEWNQIMKQQIQKLHQAENDDDSIEVEIVPTLIEI